MRNLHTQYPWLAKLNSVSEKIVETLHSKESDYKGSWKKRGGVGAFMMLARKWDRIEGIARDDHGYDIIEAGLANTADIIDDMDDLIGYLLLVRAYVLLKTQNQEEQEATNPEAMQEPYKFLFISCSNKLERNEMKETLQRMIGNLYCAKEVTVRGSNIVVECESASVVLDELIKQDILDPEKLQF